MLQRIQATKGASSNLRHYPHCPEVSKFYQGTFPSLKEVSSQGTQLPELSCPLSRAALLCF